MTRVARLLHLDEAALTRPVDMAEHYPSPSLALDPRVRAVLEAPRLGCEPGTSRVVIDELRAADVPARDPFRYDPNRLLPSSARVRQVRVEKLRLRSMGDVAELLERIESLTAHADAELALYDTESEGV